MISQQYTHLQSRIRTVQMHSSITSQIHPTVNPKYLSFPPHLTFIIYSQQKMSGQTKPVHEYFKHMQYLRHKNKLATIQQERPQPATTDLLESVHKLRSQALTFHQIEHENAISTENQKLLQKLLSISKRRPSAYSQTVTSPVMTSFQNPARKKRQRLITEMNQQMAERMLTRESQLGQGSMRRSIEQYERIKRTMTNNKRAISLSRTAHLPAIALSKSRRSLDQKHKTENRSKKGQNLEGTVDPGKGSQPQYSKHEPIITNKQEPMVIRYQQTEQQHAEGSPELRTLQK